MQEQKQEQALTQIDVQLMALEHFLKTAENPAKAVVGRASLSLMENGVKRSITPEEFARAQVNQEGKLVVKSEVDGAEKFSEVGIEPRVGEDKQAYDIHANDKSLYALSGVCSVAAFDALDQIRKSESNEKFAQSHQEYQRTITQTFLNLLSGVESLFDENTNTISGALIGKLDSEMKRLTALKDQGQKVDPNLNPPQEALPKESAFILEIKRESKEKFDQAMKTLREALETIPEDDFKKLWTSNTSPFKAELEETFDQITKLESNLIPSVKRGAENGANTLAEEFTQKLDALNTSVKDMKLAYFAYKSEQARAAIKNARAILDVNMPKKPKKFGPFNTLRELCATKLNSAKNELDALLKKLWVCESNEEWVKLHQEFETKLNAFGNIIENTISREKESSSKWSHLLKAGAALTTAGLLFGGIGTATLATGLSTAVGFTLGNVAGLFMGPLAAITVSAAATAAAAVLSAYVFPALLVLAGLYALYKAYESIHVEKQAVQVDKVMKVPGLCDAQIVIESAKDIYRGALKSNGQQPQPQPQPGWFGSHLSFLATTPALPRELEAESTDSNVYTPPSSSYGSLDSAD